MVVFSNIQNGYGYVRDCSWWFSRILKATPEEVEKEIAKGLDINEAYESRQTYALITFLDAPKGIKSTYNFNSSGWNATELARKIVESIVLNANLAKQN